MILPFAVPVAPFSPTTRSGTRRVSYSRANRLSTANSHVGMSRAQFCHGPGATHLNYRWGADLFHPSAQKRRPPESLCGNGTPGRTRTAGPRFRKPLLYPLSYRGTLLPKPSLCHRSFAGFSDFYVNQKP